MPLWVTVIFQVLFMVLVFVVVYNLLKTYVLSKLHPNKWLILGIAIVSLAIPYITTAYFKYNINGTIWQYVQSAVFIVFFLWFIDIKNGTVYKTNGRSVKGKNNIVIKPKAKPKRAQNTKNKKS